MNIKFVLPSTVHHSHTTHTLHTHFTHSNRHAQTMHTHTHTPGFSLGLFWRARNPSCSPRNPPWSRSYLHPSWNSWH